MTAPRYLIVRYTLISFGITTVSHLLLCLIRDDPPSSLISFLLVNLIWFLSLKEAISVVAVEAEKAQTEQHAASR